MIIHIQWLFSMI